MVCQSSDNSLAGTNQPFHRPERAGDVAQMRSLLAQTAYPNTPIGRHCSKPYTCRFYEHCWQEIDGLTIYTIPRLNQTKESELEARDVLYLKDVPLDFPLTAAQRKYVTFIREEEIHIDAPAIQAALETLVYPLYFFDFETIDHPIPQFRDSKPYQQIPFQYSCHRLDADGTVTHTEYLHADSDDPRRPLLEALLEDIGETGSIIVYYAPFERGRLQELAAAFPEYETRLSEMIERLWDQLDIFKKLYRDYRFGNSNSLKSVLPVVVPRLSYGALDVQNGTQAQVIWEEMLAETDTAIKEELIKQLLAYCHLDTLSMLEMHRILSTLDETQKQVNHKTPMENNDTTPNDASFALLTEFNISAEVVSAMAVGDWCQISSSETKKMLSQILRELGYQATFEPKTKCTVWQSGGKQYLVNHDQNKFERTH